MRTSSRFAAAVAPAVTALVLLAGCTTAPASTTGDTTANAPAGEAGFQAARDAYDLELAQCLRDAGFDVKDPAPGQGITESLPGIEEAASACMTEIGDPPRPDAQVDETEMLNAMLKEAECLRDRGIEVDEPQLGEAFLVPADATEEDIAACLS